MEASMIGTPSRPRMRKPLAALGKLAAGALVSLGIVFGYAQVGNGSQTRTSSPPWGPHGPLPPSADIGPGGQSVGQAAQFCLDRHQRDDGDESNREIASPVGRARVLATPDRR